LAAKNDVVWEKLMRKCRFLVLLAVCGLFGCHKVSAPPPPPPINSIPAPTAEITATPTAINPGDSVLLTWHTTDSKYVSIEGIGEVASSGKQTVKPAESTNLYPDRAR
jgi:peptidoglycan-associated lipoprotein